MPDYHETLGKLGKLGPVRIAIGALILVAAIVGMAALGTIDAGHRGVHMRFSAVTGRVLDEGLYYIIPLVDSVREIDVRIQKDEVKASASSSDLQTVDSTVAVNYHLDPLRVAEIFQTVGMEYNTRLIAPALQEAVKATTAGYTAEELITKRSLVRDGIKALLREKLQPHGIIIDEFNIIDFTFSASFNASIELKVTAEQEALAAQNKLAQVKFEAEQAIELARGKAQAMEVEAKALTSSPQILQLRALEMWDGVIPRVVTDGAIPFISVDTGGQ